MQPPRVTRAMLPFSEPCGSVVERGSLGLPEVAQRSRLTGFPSAPTTLPTSTTRWSFVSHDAGTPDEPGTKTICLSSGLLGATTVRTPLKTWAFVVAPTLIASGAVPGEPTVPRPKKSRSFPAEMTGTTPAFATLATASIKASRRGSVWGPPPEKLMTSIPSCTAASKAATISGVLPEQQPPRGFGVLKTR